MDRGRRLASLAAALVTIHSEPLHAQNRAQEAATLVARRFFNALAERRWEEAALSLDESALVTYRESLATWRRRAGLPRETTVEDLLRHDPTMPREAAEYQVAQFQRYRGMASRLPDFPSIPSIDSLMQLTPLDLGIAWLRGQDIREGLRDQLRSLNCPRIDSLAVALPLEITILGSVSIADTAALVLYTDPLREQGLSGLHSIGPSVLHLRRRSGEWRVVPRSGLLTPTSMAFQVAACPN